MRPGTCKVADNLGASLNTLIAPVTTNKLQRVERTVGILNKKIGRTNKLIEVIVINNDSDDDDDDDDVENSSLNSQTKKKKRKRKRKVSLNVKSGDDNGDQTSDSKRQFVGFLGWERNYQNWFFGINGSTPYKELCDEIQSTKGRKLEDVFKGKGSTIRALKSRQKGAAEIVAHVMVAYGVDAKVASQYLGNFKKSLPSRSGNACTKHVTEYLKRGGSSGVIKEYFDEQGYTPNDSGNDDNGGGGGDNSTSPGEHIDNGSGNSS